LPISGKNYLSLAIVTLLFITTNQESTLLPIILGFSNVLTRSVILLTALCLGLQKIKLFLPADILIITITKVTVEAV